MYYSPFMYGAIFAIVVMTVVSYIIMKKLRFLEIKMSQLAHPLDYAKSKLALARGWFTLCLVLFMEGCLHQFEIWYGATLPQGNFAGILVLAGVGFRVLGMYVVAMGIAGWVLKFIFPKLTAKCTVHILSRQTRNSYRTLWREIPSPVFFRK